MSVTSLQRLAAGYGLVKSILVVMELRGLTVPFRQRIESHGKYIAAQFLMA